MKYKPNKTDKAKHIVCALYNLNKLPDSDNTVVLRYSRKPLSVLNDLYTKAIKVIDKRTL